MAVGGIAIYRQATGLQSVGTSLAALPFDTTTLADAGYALDGGTDTITLPDAAPYLVSYTIAARSAGGTGASAVASVLKLDADFLVEGIAAGFFNRSALVNECWLSAATIIRTTSTNQMLELQGQRTDNGSGTVEIAPGTSGGSGIQIIRLSDAWSYCRLVRAADGLTSTSGWQKLHWGSSVELDTESFGWSAGQAQPSEILLKRRGRD